MWRRVRRACRQRTFAPSETRRDTELPDRITPRRAIRRGVLCFRAWVRTREHAAADIRRSAEQQCAQFVHGRDAEGGVVSFMGVAETPVDEDHRNVVRSAALDVMVSISDEHRS